MAVKYFQTHFSNLDFKTPFFGFGFSLITYEKLNIILGSGSGTGGAAASANAAAAASAAGGTAANNGTNHHMPPHPPFELDFDKFDMLSEFPDLTDHYNNSASAMIHHGASGPLLSSAMANTQQPHQTASNQQPAVHGQGGAQAGQNNSAKHSHRHNITDYSPDWAWSDVSRDVEISETFTDDYSKFDLGKTRWLHKKNKGKKN